MSFKKIIIFLLIFLNINNLLSINVNINRDFVKNITEVDFEDKLNKVGIKFENNKIIKLNSLKLEQNGIEIKSDNLKENQYLTLTDNRQYFLIFNYYPLEISSTIPQLNDNKLDIKSIKYLNKNLIIRTTYYYIKNQKISDFYFDYSSLLYTQKGLLNYVSFVSNYLTLESEFAITRYGLFSSYTATFELKKIKFFFNTKNINEKYNLGLIFNDSNIKVEVVDKISQISIYGGQGVKRNFSIDSNLKFEFLINKIKSILYLSIYHEVDYDVFLNRSIIQKFRVRNKLDLNGNDCEISLSYKEKLSAYLIINYIKISYYENKLYLQLIYKTEKDKTSFQLKLSTSGTFEIAYMFSL